MASTGRSQGGPSPSPAIELVELQRHIPSPPPQYTSFAISSSHSSNSTMARRRDELDVFVLTFNCAKTPVDVDVFARHLRGALADGRSSLPDLVVFSLQEIAPLANGYLGGQFLAPYFNPLHEALNFAALELEQYEQEQEHSSLTPSLSTSPSASLLRPGQPRRAPLQRSRSALSTLFRRRPDYPYKLVEARNVGMTGIMLFARTPGAIHHLAAAECAFGIANMGNKGAIALRVMYAGDSQGEEGDRVAEVTFVATHLAAMEYNLRRRNANWASICSSCLFEDPKKTLPEVFHTDEIGAKNVVEASTHSSTPDGKQTDGGVDIPPETDEERQALLQRRLQESEMPSEYARHLHDISIFKPGSHLFVAGDLNYRISTTTPSPGAAVPNLHNYLDFLERDQLTQERRVGRTLHGLTEAPITFPPTYKIKHLSHERAAEAANQEEYTQAVEEGREGEVVPWKFATHRWPGWTDRILYLDLPKWVKRRYAEATRGGSSRLSAPEIKVHAYRSLPTMLTSDHQPVFFRASVPLLPPEDLVPPESDWDTDADDDKNDPRLHLPVPIDTGAFERRAAARRKELVAGVTAYFLSTKEGGFMVTVLVFIGLFAWWQYKGYV